MADAVFKYQSEAFAFAEEIDRVSDVDEIVRRMQRVLSGQGLESLAFAGVPNVTQQFEDLILVERMPAGFVRNYVEREYVHVDPVLGGLRRSDMPFEYKTEYDPESEPRAAEVMQFRRDFGLCAGFVIPVARRDGNGFVSATGERPEIAPRSKPAIHLMGLYAFDRISGLLRPRFLERRALTEREREVLTWVAVGKSAWEIGEILSIAKRTVDAHTQTAMRKLGAASRTQAVAVALRDHTIAV